MPQPISANFFERTSQRKSISPYNQTEIERILPGQYSSIRLAVRRKIRRTIFFEHHSRLSIILTFRFRQPHFAVVTFSIESCRTPARNSDPEKARHFPVTCKEYVRLRKSERSARRDLEDLRDAIREGYRCGILRVVLPARASRENDG